VNRPRAYDGWLPPQTQIIKVLFEEGDAHAIGEHGTVLGSYGHPDVGMGYFVEWKTLPMHAVFVMARKIARRPLS
jgi:hypothetical protein